MYLNNKQYNRGMLAAVITLFGIQTTLAQTKTQNYIQTRVPRRAITTNTKLDVLSSNKDSVMTTIQYFDGLGRPLQTVQRQASPAAHDIVQPFAYDAYGREAVKYLPYASTSADGSYKANAISSEIGSFYYPGGSGTSGAQQTNGSGIVVNPNPYSVTNFEPSPLNRVTEQGAPGTPWQPAAGHTQKIVYTNNDQTSTFSTTPGSGNLGSRIVALYKAAINADQSRTLTVSGTYAPGQLYVTIAKNENWVSTADGCTNTTEEYKDKEEHVLLKRTYNLNALTNKIEELSTYYVYDDLGNLVFVLPPGANPDAGITSVANQATLDNFCYQYRYDERNRLIQKKLPGKGPEYIVYNKLDQPVLTQDANQRLTNQWSVIKYDALGRVIVTGLWNAGSLITTSALKTSIYAGAQWDVRDNTNTTTGYALTSYPAITSVLTVNYYDDYAFNGNPYTAFTASLLVQTQGLLTGSRTAILNADGTIGQQLWAVHGYDGRGRETLTIKQHYKGGTTNYNTGNIDITSTAYNFDNTVDRTRRAHIYAGISTPKLGVANQYYYDHIGRPTEIWKSVWDQAFAQPNGTLNSYIEYNEVGQVRVKHLHLPGTGQSFKQDINYSYNERGWLTAINNPNSVSATQAFGEQLTYNSGTSPQYNGNISGMSWQTMVPAGLGLTQQLQTYTYSYDKLNRLLLASYNTTGAVNKFNEQLDYDLMGNIAHLNRTNTTTAGQYLNKFTYDYTTGGTGNKLWAVTDVGTAAQGSTYTYDANGNMTKDTRNQVTNIKYNLLNYPATVTRTPGNISYVYDASGNKLQKVSGSITREYIDGIEYSNGTIEQVKTEEGRATPNGNTYVYEYYLKDHLGNTRAMINQTGVITQVQDYYAFGLEMNPGNAYTTGAQNNYKYNGKEKQQETGEYDYGARFYDPVIGRWTSEDPKAEKFNAWSPYVYVFDNPVRLIDPDGMSGEDPRWSFYQNLGSSAISAAQKAGASNEFKGLYLIVQRRVENGFNQNPPGNNPMNIKGNGDEGQVSEVTTEYIGGKAQKLSQNFAKFSSVEKGFDGYLDLLQNNFPDAYASLKDNNKTIGDFANGLQNGKLGSYATDPNYAEKLTNMLKSVVSDYTKILTKDISQTSDQIVNLYKQYYSSDSTDKQKDALYGQLQTLWKKQADDTNKLSQLNLLR